MVTVNEYVPFERLNDISAGDVSYPDRPEPFKYKTTPEGNPVSVKVTKYVTEESVIDFDKGDDV